MRLDFGIQILLLSLVVGCAKGPQEPTQPQFVPIEMDDDDDLMGTELMRATADCGDLRALEPAALMGRLNDGEIRCLNRELRRAERQTVRDKISRVLMADAWAKGDRHRWEGVVRHHVREIDRSDADLSFKLASHLLQRGPEFAQEAMYWAEMAMENRSQWEGELHVARVTALYRIRAMAAAGRWEWLEEAYLKEPSEELATKRDRARDTVKNLALEWLVYTRSAGRDDTVAMQLCVTAAGTRDFCREQ